MHAQPSPDNRPPHRLKSTPHARRRNPRARLRTPRIKPARAMRSRRVDPKRVPAEVVPGDDDQVAQQQDRALEVVALALTVHVRQQEDAQDDRHHVPLREEEGEGVARGFEGVGRRHGVQCGEED